MLIRDVADKLHDEHRLADAGSAEQTYLTAAGIRGEQVNDLDAGLQHLGGGQNVGKRGRIAVDGQMVIRVDGAFAVDRLADDVEHTSQRRFADGHAYRRAGVNSLESAGNTVRGGEGYAANRAISYLLHDLKRYLAIRQAYLDRVIQIRQLTGGKMNVNYRAYYFFYYASFHS